MRSDYCIARREADFTGLIPQEERAAFPIILSNTAQLSLSPAVIIQI